MIHVDMVYVFQLKAKLRCDVKESLLHALACVPVKESLSSEHGSELLGDSLEDFLDGGRVSHKGGGHFQASGRDV